jgi:hypothetical protein
MADETASKQNAPQANSAAQAAPQGVAPQWAPQPTMPPQPWPGYYAQPQSPRPARQPLISNKPTIVSWLLAVVGILGLVMAAMFFMGSTVFGDIAGTSSSGPFEIHGVVDYTNGSGAQGVNVTLVGTSIATVTDNEGNFVLYNVPRGEQRVQVEKAGYLTLVMKLSVPGFPSMGGNMGSNGPKVKFVLSPGTGQAETTPPFAMTVNDIRALIAVCGAIVLVLSILALLGAVYASKRTNFGMVIVGTLAGICSIGFGIGTVLAFVALFIVLLGSDEFKGRAKEE